MVYAAQRRILLVRMVLDVIIALHGSIQLPNALVWIYMLSVAFRGMVAMPFAIAVQLVGALILPLDLILALA